MSASLIVIETLTGLYRIAIFLDIIEISGVSLTAHTFCASPSIGLSYRINSQNVSPKSNSVFSWVSPSLVSLGQSVHTPIIESLKHKVLRLTYILLA